MEYQRKMLCDVQWEPSMLKSFAEALSETEQIALITHVGPDGDTVGSVLGLAALLRRVYPDSVVHTIAPDRAPAYLDGVPGFDRLKVYQENPEETLEIIRACDMVGCIDFNTPRRVRWEALQEAVMHPDARRFMIDHHPYPVTDSFDFVFSYPQTSSTCELVYFLAMAMGWESHFTPDAAKALLTGVITDTGCFMHNSSRPEVYTAMAGLIGLGADKNRVIDELYHRSSENQVRLRGFVLNEKMTLIPDKKAAYIMLNREELKRFHATKGDTEGFVNMPLDIEGIACSCLIREDEDQIKISLRSLGDFAVNGIAERAFGGGGHRNAAGAEYVGTSDEALSLFLRELEVENKNYYR